MLNLYVKKSRILFVYIPFKVGIEGERSGGKYNID